MTDKLKEVFAGAQAGTHSAVLLDEAIKEESKNLREIGERMAGENGAWDFMKVGESLDGDTPAAKMAEYARRAEQVGDAERWWNQLKMFEGNVTAMGTVSSQMQARAMANFDADKTKPAPPPDDWKSLPAGDDGLWPTVQLVSQLRRDDSREGIKTLAQHRAWEGNYSNDGVWGVKNVTVTGEMRPDNRVVRPAQYRIRFLDRLETMPISATHDVFFREPALKDGDDSEVAWRSPYADLVTDNYDVARQSIELHRYGGVQLVDNNLLVSQPSLVANAAARLRRTAERRVEHFVLNGTGAAPQFDGILDTTAGNKNILSGDSVHDVAANSDSYEVLVERVSTLIDRGYDPSVVILRRSDWMKIFNKLRAQQFSYADFEAFPMGAVLGTPLAVSDRMPANVVLVADMGMDNIHFAMQTFLAVDTSEQRYWEKDATGVRVVGMGNIAIDQPAAFIKITSFDNAS